MGYNNTRDFDIQKFKYLVKVSDLENMDTYQSNAEILIFFQSVLDVNADFEDELEKIKKLTNEFLLELIEESTLSIDENGKESWSSLYKTFPHNGIAERLTIKSIYLGLRYFYRDDIKISYNLYNNPDYVKIKMTFK